MFCIDYELKKEKYDMLTMAIYYNVNNVQIFSPDFWLVKDINNWFLETQFLIGYVLYKNVGPGSM